MIGHPQRMEFYKMSALLLGLTALVGCQGMGVGYIGAQAGPAKRIALVEAGSQQGLWQAPDLQFDYRYEKQGQHLQLSGVVNLHRTKNLEFFTFDIHFLGSEGTILGSQVLVRAAYRQMESRWQVRGDYALPAGTAAIAFSYDGRSRGIGRESGSGSDFWQTPL